MNTASRLPRHGLIFGFLGCLCLVSAGCAAALGTGFYIFHGDEIDPPCKKLMKGKVAIVCRPHASASYQYGDVANQLARALHNEIKPKLKKRQKVELISPHIIETHCDNMESGSDFLEIAEAVGADQVIAIDLHEYSHMGGTQLFQGRAYVSVTLMDVKTKDILYDAPDINEFLFPANTKIQVSEQMEGRFQQEFIRQLAHHISKAFVPFSRWESKF